MEDKDISQAGEMEGYKYIISRVDYADNSVRYSTLLYSPEGVRLWLPFFDTITDAKKAITIIILCLGGNINFWFTPRPLDYENFLESWSELEELS